MLMMMLIASVTSAAVYYDLEDQLEISESGTSLGISYANIDSLDYTRVYLAPNFPLGPVKAGLDINYYIPMGDHDTPSELNKVVLRHLSYDYEDKHGFQWGHLRNITFGQGLLVDAFDSGGGGSSEFTEDKAGILAYATLYETKISVLNTNEKVQGARIERPVVELAGVPLVVGATYFKDDDGINDSSTGTLVSRDAVESYAADVSYPIGGNAATLFVEHAEIQDEGNGTSVGLRGNLLKWLNYRAEFRSLGEGYAPSYFNNVYQSTSFDFDTDALQEDTSGFLVAAGTQFFGGKFRAGMQYENYEDINLFSSAVGWSNIARTSGVLNITKPFSNVDDDRLVAVADVYMVNPSQPYDVLMRFKRVYESNGDYEQSYSMGVRLKPSRLLPFF